MGTLAVDQIGPHGELLQGVDSTLTPAEKYRLVASALPDSSVEIYQGTRVVRAGRDIILAKQVTHLGFPWPEFKKRIQIPRAWVDLYWAALNEGLNPRFIGVYHYQGVTIFVDFDPRTYVQRKANNSAAHVATNDLYQAQTLGVFTRTDHNGNTLTSLRFDRFASYLHGAEPSPQNPYVDVFAAFNAGFLTGQRLEAMDCIDQMFAATWPEAFQAEWAGFYLEYRVDEFLRRAPLPRLIEFQKDKRRGALDFDLAFLQPPGVAFFGDLKASNVDSREAPGNDAADLLRCIEQYGRFWYVLYEHKTWHSRDEDNQPAISWNEWRRSMGHVQRGEYNPMSYAAKFKSAVRFVGMKILEVNEANFGVVLKDFNQGHQPSGDSRAVKVMISKRNIDNFLIYSEGVPLR